jgi:hypothetical protein
MKSRISTTLFCLSLGALAHAQTAVPVTAEPHHHQVYSDSNVRVFAVEVDAHTSTLLHQHDRDYVWVALGASAFVNAVAGKPEVPVVALDASVHFSRGGFAHIARIDGDAPFRNVTIELLQPQDNPRNLCEQVLAGQPMNCPDATAVGDGEFLGAAARPAFATDQTRVTFLAIAAGRTLRLSPSKNPPLLVALSDLGETVKITCEVPGETLTMASGMRPGQGFTPSRSVSCALQNTGRTPVRFLAMDFAAGTRAPR